MSLTSYTAMQTMNNTNMILMMAAANNNSNSKSHCNFEYQSETTALVTCDSRHNLDKALGIEEPPSGSAVAIVLIVTLIIVGAMFFSAWIL